MEWSEDAPELALIDLVNADDEAGLTPMHIATMKNRPRCVQILIANRAECTRSVLHNQNAWERYRVKIVNNETICISLIIEMQQPYVVYTVR